jgi:hypothetical protein
MIVSSRSRFKLARGGVGVCSIGGSRIVGFIAVRPRVPRSDGVPDAPYDRRTDAYPGELAPTPVVPGVAICATIGRSRAGVACASNAGARSNGDGGFTAALISPYAPPALDRAIRSLSICPRRKNSLISVNGVGESLAVSAAAASFANRVVLVAPPTSPIRPVVVVVPALAPPAPFPRVLTLCSSSIARPTSIVRFSFAPPSKPSPSSSPCQKNPPTSADAIFVALRTGVATLRHIFFAFDDGASRVSSIARPSLDDGVMTSVLIRSLIQRRLRRARVERRRARRSIAFSALSVVRAMTRCGDDARADVVRRGLRTDVDGERASVQTRRGDGRGRGERSMRFDVSSEKRARESDDDDDGGRAR